MSDGPGSETPEPAEPTNEEITPVVDEAQDEKIPAWAWWLFGVAMLAIIFLVWYAVANSTDSENAPVTEPTMSASPSASPSPSMSPSASPSPSVTPSETPSPEPSDSPTPMPSPTDVPPSTTFTDGTFVAGTDVAVGTYRPAAAVTAGQCAWALEGAKASDPATNPPLGVPAGGIPTVTLAAGDTLATKGCGTWSTVDPNSLFKNGAAQAVLTDGVWLVGEEVRPGTYQTQPVAPGTVPEKLCRFTVSTDIGSNFSEIVVRGFVTADAGQVSLEPGQQIESTNCGDWIALSK